MAPSRRVVYALQRLCFGHLVAGDLAAVRNRAEEALALGQSIGQRAMTVPPMAWLTLLAALQDRDDYDTRLRELDEVVAAYPLGILTDPVHDLTRWAKGIRAAGEGDTFGALHHLSRFRLPVLARMAAVERIDAAVRAGEPDLARRWVDELAGFADATGRPWALATVAYGRAMTTADPAEAEASVPGGAVPPPARRSPPGRGAHPPRLRGVAASHPASHRRPPTPAAGPGDLRRRARGSASYAARPRSCARQARQPASATSPR